MRRFVLLSVLILGCGGSPVADLPVTKCKGLVLQPNDSGTFPAGAMAVADNVVATRDDVVEPRRGLPIIAAKALSRLFPFKDYLVGWFGGTLCRSADGIAWSDYSGTYTAPLGAPVRASKAGGSLYFTSGTGVRRLEAVAGPVYGSGIPVAADGYAFGSYHSAGDLVFAPNTQAAYRFAWGRRDANGVLMLGSPSGRALATNVTGTTNHGYFGAAVPQGVDSSFFLQAYRSPVVPIDGVQSPSDEMGLVAELQVPPLSAHVIAMERSIVGVITCTTSAPHGWTSIASGGVGVYLHVAPNVGAFREQQDMGIQITGSTTFKYDDPVSAGPPAIASTPTNFDVEVTVIQGEDYAPTPGTALYASPSQQGIAQSNDRIALANDLAEFRGTLIASSVTDWPRIEVDLLGVSAPVGLQAGDTITIDGTVFTFRASVPDRSDPATVHDLELITGTSPADGMAQTARTMAHWLNAMRPRICSARYLSSDTDLPGKVLIEALNPSDALTVTVSRSSAWSPKSPQVQAAPRNRIAWSKKLQPDAFPLLNYASVGSTDNAIERVIATRDSVFILKDGDGIFRLTGDSPETFRIDPFDYNTHIAAPETAVAVDNKVMMLTEQGFVAVTDTGVEIIGRDIEPAILPLVSGPMRTLTASLAFAIVYESAHKYIAFLPSVASDTVCTQAYVYDTLTQAWTRWKVNAVHGVVNPVDDKLYLVDGTSVRQELKTFTRTDYHDGSAAVTVVTPYQIAVELSDASVVAVGDVLSQGSAWGVVTAKAGNVCSTDRDVSGFIAGAATVYKAIPVTLEPAPIIPKPGCLSRFDEVQPMLRDSYATVSAMVFANEESWPVTEVGRTANCPLGPTRVSPRFPVPRERCRGEILKARWLHAQAWCPWVLQGFSVRGAATNAKATPRPPSFSQSDGGLGIAVGTQI